MAPVCDQRGRPVPLPTSILNKWGYALEFDNQGRSGAHQIDFEAMAAHLACLRDAAHAHRIRILHVVFDTELQQQLFATERGSALQESIRFGTKPPRIRHDDHYHVDFENPEGAGAADPALLTGS